MISLVALLTSRFEPTLADLFSMDMLLIRLDTGAEGDREPSAVMNKMCLWNTNAPATTIFLKTVTLIFDFDLDRWPWLWHLRKGFTPKNRYVKYESSITYHSVMANVKAFANKHPDMQTKGQTNKQTSQKLYAPNLSMQGHKKKFSNL